MRSVVGALGAMKTLALVALLAGCDSRAARATNVVHAVSAGALAAPDEPAIIALPVTLALTAVRSQLETSFPPSDSLDQAKCSSLGGVVCHQYVYRRDTLDLRMKGDRFSLFTRLRYRGRVAIPVGGAPLGSCGYAPDPMKRAEMRFETSLFWRNDWKLASRGTALSARLIDPCQVTALNIDATPVMQRMLDAQVRSLTREVDLSLPKLADLRPTADSLWHVLQEPTPVDSAGTLWLVMSPETVGLAPLAGTGATAVTSVVITARPRIVAGAKPAATKRPLPLLTLAPQSKGIHVPVRIELPYDELSKRATAQLLAETANEAVKVRGVQIRAAADTAVVNVDVAGRLNATLTLVGRVGYDTLARQVRIDDLHYTVESHGLLSRIKATLGAPFVKRAIDAATGHGKLSVGEQLDAMRMQLTKQLNRPLAPNMAVGGGVQSIRVLGVETTPTAFVVRVVLDGEAGLWVR